MRGKKAKTIRREIYGGRAIRVRTYQRDGMMGPLSLLNSQVKVKLPGHIPLPDYAGTVRCGGLRAEYQAAKCRAKTPPSPIGKKIE